MDAAVAQGYSPWTSQSTMSEVLHMAARLELTQWNRLATGQAKYEARRYFWRLALAKGLEVDGKLRKFELDTTIPADGDCLYHSIGRKLGLSAAELRRQLHDYASNNYDALIANHPHLFHGVTKPALLHSLGTSGIWGGAPEIAVAAEIFQRRILVFVYGQRPVQAFGVGSREEPILLCYEAGSHYMLLEPVPVG